MGECSYSVVWIKGSVQTSKEFTKYDKHLTKAGGWNGWKWILGT